MKTEDVGATPFMRACQFADLGEVLTKLEKNATVVNRTDRNNNTALMYAIENDDISSMDRAIIIKKLLEKGADIDAFNMQFETAAILAAKNNDPVTLKLLLDMGVTGLDKIDMIEGKNVYEYAAKNSCKNVMDDYTKAQQVVDPLSAPTPKPSLLTRFLNVLWTPFRLIGSVFKSIGVAVVQFFVDRTAKPKRPSDTSDASEEDIDDRVFYDMDNPQSETRLTSQQPEPELVKPLDERVVTKKKGWFDFSKEKKPATQFSSKAERNAEQKLQVELQKIRGITPPGSPRKPNQQDI